ncbi:MAG: hypothetical protein PHO78_08860 [Methanomicrobium sp.]|nr:hypothetical protein [Methanomicrobium sp.]
MVGLSDSGQLFTIEGLTAAIIMLASAYFVLGTGMVFTPGDVHITDMQLKQLGNDALLMMETPDSYNGENKLSEILDNKDTALFNSMFSDYLRKKTGATEFINSLEYNSTVYYVHSGEVKSYPFGYSDHGDNPGRNPAIRCGRYVSTNWDGADTVVKLEVLIWRD